MAGKINFFVGFTYSLAFFYSGFPIIGEPDDKEPDAG